MADRDSSFRFIAVIVGCLLWLLQTAALATDGRSGHLVSVAWLQDQLKTADLLLLDASSTRTYANKHIAGAVSVDLYSFGVGELPLAQMEMRLQSWGVSSGRKIVVYDEGGSMMATRLFFDLVHQGFPAADLFILDGGLAKWQETGAPVTKEPTPPKAGNFRITRVVDDVRVRLPEFLNASGDPARHALVDALGANYHFGQTKFFDRAGHVPNSIMLPSEDFYRADKTFKSAAEIKAMVDYLGIKPEQQILTYCGGGVAASVPFFALKYILGYPQVRMYKESLLEWLQDERNLPLWTYDAPFLQRDMQWLNGWGGGVLRMFGLSNVSIVDVRGAAAYRTGHVPFALNIPADVFKRHLNQPDQLATLLGASGVNPVHEAVIVSERGLDPSAALAYVMLERTGQKKVSILLDSVDEWALQGLPLAKQATVVGARKTPQDQAVAASAYAAALRPGVVLGNQPAAAAGQHPTVYIASGAQLPSAAVDGKLVHLPYTTLLNGDGRPKAAKDLWSMLAKAGVPRYAQIVFVADDPGEAAVNYVVFKLMGFPDLKLLLS